MCAEGCFDDVDDEGEEDEAGDQIVQEVKTSLTRGEEGELKTSYTHIRTRTHTHADNKNTHTHRNIQRHTHTSSWSLAQSIHTE